MEQGSIKLALMALLSGGLVSGLALPTWAQENSLVDTAIYGAVLELAQASPTQITDVRLEETDPGLQVVLDIAEGELSAPTTAVSGDALIVEIENAVLLGDEIEQFEPAAGIAMVQVSALSGDRVQVVITGIDAVPVADVSIDAAGLTLSVVPGISQAGETNEPLRIVVTGEEDEGYNPSSASTATRTDTPLRDIPQSIQVIPQQILEDQQVTRLNDALRNAPGVNRGDVSPRLGGFESTLIRGFGANYLINGLEDNLSNTPIFDPATTERIEVLRGPASVLYGQGSTGGIVNLVTKQPLSEPFYSVTAAAGSFDFYRGALDLSGPLNNSGTVLYRFNAAAQTTESFIDFFDSQRYVLAPVLSWQISDNTNITFETEYSQITEPFEQGIPAIGTVLPNPNGDIPRDRYISEPSDTGQYESFRVGYDLQHRFSDNWQLRNAFRFTAYGISRVGVFSTSLEDDGRTLNRGVQDANFEDLIYNLDTYVVGEFATGPIQHQLVAGVNLFRRDAETVGFIREADPLDLFSPVYGRPFGDVTFRFDDRSRTDNLGLYVQDQITLTDNLKLLLGGRFDIAYQEQEDRITSTETDQQDEVFSPRVGIVYQPIPEISLYGSYTRSFQPVTGRSFNGDLFQPERGTQYELGLKADIIDRLSANLVFYDLTRTNVETADLVNPSFSIQTGEQRSRGIELNVAGEILPGWNILAGYAYTDAEITEDNTFEEDNGIANVPENAFNLWTTYQIQQGDLEGLGFGLGLFFVGDRPGDLANSFEIPSYLQTDASVFYERDRFRAGLNFRNLFDIDYFVSARGTSRVTVGDPFTVEASLSWQF
ncbi:hypothetical protein N836_13235 [Leptolyngbya sp. Heron Island J]|uniref:TonB-dependent siderophore receptor n=1 Tax=Leptolyngbya sp. Heron Island J TaxID=1385935 RepID=UPI0003B9CC10|nr:TonB-dependent siderophore receptor [Leptolyngbya sp. Heron Island J]ESA35156.1 hypothetical protein N836_13235 [Leptolyngbya sp. Heron Island J]